MTTTVNPDSAGPLLKHLDKAMSAIALAQETRAHDAGLHSLSKAVKDNGYHGVVDPSLRSEKP
eukprot:9495516-Pyramimonas_sp.AAC.1